MAGLPAFCETLKTSAAGMILTCAPVVASDIIMSTIALFTIFADSVVKYFVLLRVKTGTLGRRQPAHFSLLENLGFCVVVLHPRVDGPTFVTVLVPNATTEILAVFPLTFSLVVPQPVVVYSMVFLDLLTLKKHAFHFIVFIGWNFVMILTTDQEVGTTLIMTSGLVGDPPPVCVSEPCGW